MRTLSPAALVASLLLLSSPPAAAQEEQRELLAAGFQERLEAIAADFDGVAGIEAIDLTTGRRFGLRRDWVFPQGSAIKVPILLELFRRAEEEPGLLRRRRLLTAGDQVGGSGVLQHLTDGGSELALEDLAVLMILESDNTATNALIDVLGMASVNRLMDELGAPRTRLQREMIRPDASIRGEENLSTPAEAAALMARIDRCELPMSASACARVREILEIPKGGPVTEPIPGSVDVAFKPGGVEGVTTVWALVDLPTRPYVLTVMTSWGGDGGEVVRRASEAAWRYFSRLARASEHGVRVPLDVYHPPPGGTP